MPEQMGLLAPLRQNRYHRGALRGPGCDHGGGQPL